MTECSLQLFHHLAGCHTHNGRQKIKNVQIIDAREVVDKKEFYDTVDGNVKGFSGVSWGILPACNAGDSGSVPRMWRSPGGGNGYPLQYSCLENPMDRGA